MVEIITKMILYQFNLKDLIKYMHGRNLQELHFELYLLVDGSEFVPICKCNIPLFLFLFVLINYIYG